MTPASLRRVAAAAWLLALPACTGLPPAPPPPKPARVLLLNDVYVADTLADGTGGLARAAEVRRRIASEGPVLFVLAGDVLSPSLLSKYYHGRQMIEVLNAAGLDYATFGNHEFELARDTLVARIRESRFRWLSANCVEASGAPFPLVQPWDTVRTNGRLVGLFGVTLQGQYRSYVRCLDPDSAAAAAVDTLTALGAELIFGLTHQEASADLALLGRDGRIDAIFGGHEHTAHTIEVGGRYLLKADANARSVQFLNVWGAEDRWRQAPRLIPLDARIPFDTTVQRLVRAWGDSAARRLGADRVIGTLTAPIDARDQLQRRQESALGGLVTDAMRAGTGADVALLNAGTLRLDDVIPAGPISTWRVESLFLFADETRTVTVTLTGARLRDLLEHGVSDRNLGRGGFLQVAGIRFAFDPARPSGSRLVGPVLDAAGAAIDAARPLRVALPAYPACEGGDGFVVPEAAEPCRRWVEAPRAADLVIRHIEAQPAGRVVPPAAGRIRVQGAAEAP